MGKTRPRNDSRFSNNARPTLPGFSLAPIKAIDLGVSIVVRIGRRSDTIVSAELLSFASAAFMIQFAVLICPFETDRPAIDGLLKATF
jgi:hypothetical protein